MSRQPDIFVLSYFFLNEFRQIVRMTVTAISGFLGEQKAQSEFKLSGLRARRKGVSWETEPRLIWHLGRYIRYALSLSTTTMIPVDQIFFGRAVAQPILSMIFFKLGQKLKNGAISIKCFK